MRNFITTRCAPLAAALLVASAPALASPSSQYPDAGTLDCAVKMGTVDDDRLALHGEMRRLWSEHVFFTRSFVIGTIEDLPDTRFVTQRLLDNQNDIGAAFGHYFGAAEGDRLTAMLRQHVLIAVFVVDAARDGDEARLETARDAWFRNADRIARFLSRFSDEWTYDDVRAMLHDHLTLKIDAASARIGGDYAKEITSFDAIHIQSGELADALAAGIIAENPDDFGCFRR